MATCKTGGKSGKMPMKPNQMPMNQKGKAKPKGKKPFGK